MSWRAVAMLALAALYQEQMAVTILGVLAAFVLARRLDGERLPMYGLVVRYLLVLVARVGYIRARSFAC